MRLDYGVFAVRYFRKALAKCSKDSCWANAICNFIHYFSFYIYIVLLSCFWHLNVKFRFGFVIFKKINKIYENKKLYVLFFNIITVDIGKNMFFHNFLKVVCYVNALQLLEYLKALKIPYTLLIYVALFNTTVNKINFY